MVREPAREPCSHVGRLNQKWNTHTHTHTHTGGGGALITCPVRISLLPQFPISEKDAMVRNESSSWETDVWKKYMRDATALSPARPPPCERATAQISQFTGFNELLQLCPSHRLESTLADLRRVRQRRYSKASLGWQRRQKSLLVHRSAIFGALL